MISSTEVNFPILLETTTNNKKILISTLQVITIIKI